MGRETSGSVKQRMGFASAKRPSGTLLWINAEGMDAAITTLSLIEKISARHPNWHILLTTGTIGSAGAIRDELPANVILQYGPIDQKECINRFLNYWQPNMAVLVEQEMRPFTFFGIHKRKIPAIMINAQINGKQFRRWKIWGRCMIRRMLSPFERIYAQSHYDAEKIEILGGCHAHVVGNFTYAAKPLRYDTSILKSLDEDLGDRPFWLASNTHFKEEIMLAKAHKIILEKYPNALLIIVPRYVDRTKLIRKELVKLGLEVSIRTEESSISNKTNVYICDVHEDLGLFYRISSISFVGGSLVPVGGHNLVQPAQLNCAILYGSHTYNVQVIKEELEANQASMMVKGVEDLAAAVIMFFQNKQKTAGLANVAHDLVNEEGLVLHDVLRDIEEIMEDYGY